MNEWLQIVISFFQLAGMPLGVIALLVLAGLSYWQQWHTRRNDLHALGEALGRIEERLQAMLEHLIWIRAQLDERRRLH
jgi:sensor domain CHASE-containing protein